MGMLYEYSQEDQDRINGVLTDKKLADVLMVGYGYHREYDDLYQCHVWVKSWLPGAPSNPLNETDDELSHFDDFLS